MFGIGGLEFVIILLFAFLIVGPDKLPEAAKTIGKAVAKFRDAQNQMNDVIKTETEALKAEVTGSPVKKTVRSTAGAAKTQEAKPAAEKVAEAAPAAAAAASTAEAAEEPSRPLSFSERKALYEKQRAEKLQAEKEAAEAAAKAEATEKEGE